MCTLSLSVLAETRMSPSPIWSLGIVWLTASWLFLSSSSITLYIHSLIFVQKFKGHSPSPYPHPCFLHAKFWSFVSKELPFFYLHFTQLWSLSPQGKSPTTWVSLSGPGSIEHLQAERWVSHRAPSPSFFFLLSREMIHLPIAWCLKPVALYFLFISSYFLTGDGKVHY